MNKEILERIQSEITTVQEVTSTAKILVYGPPGVGKTVFSVISPKPLFVNCEGGTLALNKLEKFKDELDIQVIKATTMEKLQDIFWYLKSGEHDRETVILDSLTEIQTISMDEILKDERRSDKLDEDIPTLKDYSKNTNQLRKLVRAFRDLPMNVVFTCLDSSRKDETDGSVEVGPKLTPKLAGDVEGYVDVMGYLFVSPDEEDPSKRKMLTQPKGKYRAKDRSGRLGLGRENPTGYEIFNLVTDGAIEIPEFVNKIIKEVKK